MCGICGCSEHHHHDSHHGHHHDDHHHHDNLVQIEQDIFEKNNHFARQNQNYFKQKNILALNIMSSPGSGKTTLLSKTITDLKNKMPISVVVGDQQTNLDAEKFKSAGADVIQINTGKICHLDAHMVGHAVTDLAIKEQSVLFIENVGNLVCPALFNLGEAFKVVLLAVTEGDNKPLKYPEMFRSANLMIMTKVDLLPYVDFSIEKCTEYAKTINPSLDIIMLSATKNNGLEHWYSWLTNPKK